MHVAGTPKFNLEVIEKLQKDGQRFAARIEELKLNILSLETQLGEQCKWKDEAFTELDKLKEALLRYGRHDEDLAGENDCRSILDGPDTCDCGLDEGFKLCRPIA